MSYKPRIIHNLVSEFLIRIIPQRTFTMSRPIEQGGKRTFFIVNSVELVCQQSKVIRNRGNFTVIPLFGDMGVDNFGQNEWTELVEKFEVSLFKVSALLFTFGNLRTV